MSDTTGYDEISIYFAFSDDEPQMELFTATSTEGQTFHKVGMSPHQAFILGNRLLEHFQKWQEDAG